MPSADRRAKLLSGLMGAKGAQDPAESEPPPPAEPAASPEPAPAETERSERSPIARIASRRAATAANAVAEEPTASPKADTGQGVLYSKGAATASTFKPWYWSYDHKDEAGSPDAETVVTRIPAPAPPPSEPPPVAVEAPRPLAASPRPDFARQEEPAPVRPEMIDDDEEKHRRGLSRIVVLLAASCVALLAAGGGFVYWQSESRQTSAPATAQVERPAMQLPAPTPVQETAPPPETPKPAVTALKAPPPPPVPPVTDAQPKPAETAAAPAVPPPAAAPKTAAPTPAAPPAPAAPSAPAASTQELAQLVTRGDELLSTGDISGARLFYERAAEQGSALAMTAVGQTYDPIILQQARVRGVRGDAKRAAEWYRKAEAAGDPQAEVRLKRLLARTGGN